MSKLVAISLIVIALGVGAAAGYLGGIATRKAKVEAAVRENEEASRRLTAAIQKIEGDAAAHAAEIKTRDADFAKLSAEKNAAQERLDKTDKAADAKKREDAARFAKYNPPKNDYEERMNTYFEIKELRDGKIRECKHNLNFINGWIADIESGKTKFATPEAKAAKLNDYKSQKAETEDILNNKLLKLRPYTVPQFKGILKLGNIGHFVKLKDEVFQVIDKNTFLLAHWHGLNLPEIQDPVLVLVAGVSTQGMTDGTKIGVGIELPQTFIVCGTHQYDTRAGARTIFKVEPLPLEEFGLVAEKK